MKALKIIATQHVWYDAHSWEVIHVSASVSKNVEAHGERQRQGQRDRERHGNREPTTVRYHYAPTKINQMYKTDRTKCSKAMEQLELS